MGQLKTEFRVWGLGGGPPPCGGLTPRLLLHKASAHCLHGPAIERHEVSALELSSRLVGKALSVLLITYCPERKHADLLAVWWLCEGGTCPRSSTIAPTAARTQSKIQAGRSKLPTSFLLVDMCLKLERGAHGSATSRKQGRRFCKGLTWGPAVPEHRPAQAEPPPGRHITVAHEAALLGLSIQTS